MEGSKPEKMVEAIHAMDLRAEMRRVPIVTAIYWDEIQKNDEWGSKLPFLKLPNDFEIKVRPSSMGAIIRFSVRYGAKQVSVYFDAHNRLGSMSEPYWEVASIGGEVLRYLEDETTWMMRDIEKELRS